jgi:hypothetical protein
MERASGPNSHVCSSASFRRSHHTSAQKFCLVLDEENQDFAALVYKVELNLPHITSNHINSIQANLGCEVIAILLLHLSFLSSAISTGSAMPDSLDQPLGQPWRSKANFPFLLPFTSIE